MTKIITTAGIDTLKAKLDVAVHGRAERWQVDNTPAGWRHLAAVLGKAGVTRGGCEARTRIAQKSAVKSLIDVSCNDGRTT